MEVNMCLQMVLDRVSKRVMQWALRKKGLPKILVKVMISLYEGSKMKIEVGFKFSEEFYTMVSVYQEFVLKIWRESVGRIAEVVGCIWPPTATGDIKLD